MGVAKQFSISLSPKVAKKEPEKGYIMDLSKKQAPVDNKERYYAEFVPDIDNFVGVKNVKNYFLLSMKDEEQSVGVLQLYNKLDGKNITKEDQARLEHFAKFVGALSKKAQYITSGLTLIIGLT